MNQILARALVRAGHQVRVVGSYRTSNMAPAYEEDQGVQVWRLREPSFYSSWVLARYRLYRTVSQWSRQGKIEIVETPDWEGCSAGWPRLPVPVVARLHGSASYFAAEMGRALNPLTFRLERASLRRADGWCSCSHYTAQKTQSLFGHPAGERTVLYNPIETQFTHPTLPRSGRQVIFTGTLTPKKGVIPLMKAWSLVVKKIAQAQLHLFGKDTRTAEIPSMQAHLLSLLDESARPSVTFHGHVPRTAIFEALNTARLAVFPSYAEAFALAPLEAMATGCPTVYSRCGSGPELIQNGHDGLLVDPNEPQAIADAILHLLFDDDLARHLGAQGRARVLDVFSLEKLLPQNEQFYQHCTRTFAARN
jgi:glycosyltransferase involved in cell wall biosynthesis